MLPIALDGFGDLVAWYLNALSNAEAREVDEDHVFIIIDTLDSNATNLALARGAGIGNVGVYNLVLCSSTERQKADKEQQDGLDHMHFLYLIYINSSHCE